MSLENRELGGLVHVHQNTSKLRRAFIFIGFGIVVFIIAGFVDDDNSFLFYFVGFMVALVGLFSLPIALISMNNTVNIYEKGFTYKLGRKTGTIRWEEMNLGDLERRTNAVGAGGLIMSLMMTADKKFVIHYGDGKKVEFNSANVPDVKGLARQISEMYSKST